MTSANGKDETIEALRATSLSEAQGDPRWRALSLGTLSGDEAEALRREAPELYELHRPFDEHEQDRLFRRVQARLAEQTRVIPRLGWRRQLPRVAGALAMAAAFAFIFVSTQHQPLDLAWSEQRGGKPDAPRLSSDPGARLTELIVPKHPIEGTIALRGALLVRPGGVGPERTRTWPLNLAATRDNELILSGTRAELFPGVGSGEWEMVVIVGRPGPALADDEVRRLADQGSDGDLRVLKKRVVLDGPCVPGPARPCREDAL